MFHETEVMFHKTEVMFHETEVMFHETEVMLDLISIVVDDSPFFLDLQTIESLSLEFVSIFLKEH